MAVSVYHSSPTNSTNFTRCCEVAICDDQSRCPQCKAEVIPASQRWEAAFGPTRRKIEREHNDRRVAQGLTPRTDLCLMCGKPRSECYC